MVLLLVVDVVTTVVVLTGSVAVVDVGVEPAVDVVDVVGIVVVAVSMPFVLIVRHRRSEIKPIVSIASKQKE